MSAIKTLVGLAAGLSTVAVVGVALAQSAPPNPFVVNPALGAGQQSTHMTSMGETGVPGMLETRPAVAYLEPAPQAALQPATPVGATQPQDNFNQTATMGAPAAPAEPQPMARADRN